MMRARIGALALLAALASSVARAEEPVRDFTFKRIGVPGQGLPGKRITVQIPEGFDPWGKDSAALRPLEKTAAAVAAPDPAAPVKPAGPRTLPYEWYWQLVSPALDYAGPARHEVALNKLAAAPEGQAVPAPRLQNLQEIARRHAVEILSATVGTRVSPALVVAVIGVESAGRSDAVSHAGAVGLMQLMPDTAARFGVTDSTKAAENIRGGVKYLDWLLGEFGGDPVLALAGYNAGENAVKRNGGVPPFAETRAYVPKVLAAWQVARGLCVTPPELVSDGCVFHVARADG